MMESLIENSKDKFFLIAGPCAIEGEGIVMDIAGQLSEICDRLEIPLCFKGSYRKANRTKLDSFTGIGDDKALSILAKVKEVYGIPVTTDIHESSEADGVAAVADVLQIPAFLCRQTQLLLAAAATGKVVNVKKGQFLAPEAMQFVAEKLRTRSDRPVLLTERGTTFGYGHLVVDFPSIPIMSAYADAVVMDCTHSLQRPNSSSGVTGGRPEFVALMAQAGLIAGARGLFIETHPDPSRALSDGANMLPLHLIEELLERALRLKSALI